MSNEIITGYIAGYTLYATIRDTSGNVYYVVGDSFESWGTSSRDADDYDIQLTDKSGGMYLGDFPSNIPNGDYFLQVYIQAGASPADADTPFGGPTAKTWNGSTLAPTPLPGASAAGMSCENLIDEIQARIGRPDDTKLCDVTWLTRRVNECQRFLAQNIPGIPSLTFRNTTSHDTTGTIRYSIADITVGDVTSDQVCRITKMWYLDGNESRELKFLPPDEFDILHPDPTHADIGHGKPKHWTQRANTTVEIFPYPDTGYQNKDLGFDGDFYATDFTTDSASASDISMADEGLILYGVWKAWTSIGNQSEAMLAHKRWTNPNPSVDEELGWLEQFKDRAEGMIAWSSNLYE